MPVKCFAAVIQGKVLRNTFLSLNDFHMACLVVVKEHEIARVAKDRTGYSCGAYVSDREVERLVDHACSGYLLECYGYKFSHSMFLG